MKNSPIDLNNTFLTRELDICGKNDATEAIVTISIGKPSKDSDDSWSCPYVISGLSEIESSTYRVKGIDSVQALINAFKVIEGSLSGTNIAKQGLLRWCGESNLPFLR